MDQNVEKLLTRINEQNIDVDLREGLIISETEEDKEVKELSNSRYYDLFKDIQSTSLKNKRKRSRFNKTQRAELKILLNKYPVEHQKIRKALKIPWTTFNRMKRESIDKIWRRRDIKYNAGLITTLDLKQKTYIRRLVNPPTFPITIKKNFKNSIDKTFDSNTKELDIREFLRTDLRFSYKRGSSRPVTSKKKTSVYLWSIFSSRILSAVYKKRLIVNIDKSSYNRSVKSNYSWLPIGCSSPILNTNCTGSTTIILGLFSNGHWLWMSVNGTVKAKHFFNFLTITTQVYWKLLGRASWYNKSCIW